MGDVAYIGNNRAEPPSGTDEKERVIGVSFGSGGGGPVDVEISIKDYIDARDEAVESRLATKLDRLPSAGQLWSAVGVLVGTILTVIGLFFGILAFGSDRFNGGLSVSPVVSQAQSEQRKVDQNQDAQLDMMNRKLDILIERSSNK